MSETGYIDLSRKDYIDIEEFREAGYLQEANRRFFHPLGLALSLMREVDGAWKLHGIWDYRDDPEGIIFGDLDNPESKEKARQIDEEWIKRAVVRMKNLGFIVQPIPENE